MDVWIVVEGHLAHSPIFFGYLSISDAHAHLDEAEALGIKASLYLARLFT